MYTNNCLSFQHTRLMDCWSLDYSSFAHVLIWGKSQSWNNGYLERKKDLWVYFIKVLRNIIMLWLNLFCLFSIFCIFVSIVVSKYNVQICFNIILLCKKRWVIFGLFLFSSHPAVSFCTNFASKSILSAFCYNVFI